MKKSVKMGERENCSRRGVGLTAGQKKQVPVLYFIIRKIAKIAMAVFFHKIEIRHGENIPRRGPVVFVANHPSSSMDAFVLSTVFKQRVHHIAHSGLFANKLKARLLSSFGVIPVFLDTRQPERRERNIEAFQECFRVLKKGEAISFFPEGISDFSRQIKKLKTGAARVVLEAERRNQYKLGVQLIPIGLYFFSRSRFRSKVLVNVGRTIDIQPYFALNEKDNFEAVNQLTGQIQRSIEHLTVNVRHTEMDRLVKNIEDMYRDELISETQDLKYSPHKTAAEFFATQKIAECVDYFYERDPQRVREMQEKIDSYKRKLKRLHLKDTWLRERTSFKQIIRAEAKGVAMAILGFPLAVYGVVNNYIPYRITEQTAKKFIAERAKILTVLFLSGGAAFSLFYSIQIFVVGYFAGSIWSLLYFLSLPASGFFSLAYIRKMREVRERLSFSFFLFTNRHLLGKMRRARAALVAEMDAAKEEYLKVMKETSQAPGER